MRTLSQAVILLGIDLRVRPVPGGRAPGGERLGKVGGKVQMREQADEFAVIEDDGDRRHAHGAVAPAGLCGLNLLCSCCIML